MQPCRNQNGHTVDGQGRLIGCEHRGRQVSRIEHDGTATVLASNWKGKSFNSPNDVVVKSDGTIWFTDPSYGIDSEYEGDASPSEIGARNVYRVDASGGVTLVVDDMVQPNGLAFSPDESLLYVCDTGRSHVPDCAPVIRAYPVKKDGKSLGRGRVVRQCDVGAYDGFRVDTAGRSVDLGRRRRALLRSRRHAAGQDPDIDEVVANLVFGGPKRNRLFICATTSIRSIYVNAQGIAPVG